MEINISNNNTTSKNNGRYMKSKLNIRIDDELMKRILIIKEDTGFNIAFIIRTIIKDYVDRYEKNKMINGK